MSSDPLAPPDRPERTSQIVERPPMGWPEGFARRLWNRLLDEEFAPADADVFVGLVLAELGDVAVPARAHQENFFAMAARHEQENDDLARSGTTEIRDRQPAAVTDAGHQGDCAETIERCAQVADSMVAGPWGAPHDGITPGSLATMIARAIRDLKGNL